MRFAAKSSLQFWLVSAFAAFQGLAIAQEPDEAVKPTIEIVRLELLDSFANYPIDPESVYAPGDFVNVAFNLRNYSIDDVYRMKVRWRITTEGPRGLVFAPGTDGVFDTELAPQDDGWEPLVRYQAQVPHHAPSGTYRIDVEAVDELSEAIAVATLGVRVAGSNVERSDVLTVQNFRFSLTEGGSPMQQLVYQPGSTIFASFDITGYGLGEGNAYELASELKLLDSEGATIYTFNPESEKGASFYPRLSVPAQFHFDLDPTIEAGDYTLSLLVTDAIGGQSFAVQRSFEVR